MYIRTKDGVYGLVDTYYMCVDGVEIYMYDNNGRGVEIRGSQILNQSENLAELCDGFYVDKCKEEFLLDEMFDDWYDTNTYYKNCAKSGIDVYGFIKTDKGLIYVAKMNEKGELELI